MRRSLSLLVPLALAATTLHAQGAPREGVATLAADAEARWVPFDLTPGNQIRFTLTLDDKPVTAILDTGVSYSVLARASAAVDPARVRADGQATAIGGGASGAVPVGWLATRRLTIGGLTRTGGGVTVADLPALATGSARAVDMLVGRDVTGGHALDIDYANHRFRLLPSGRLPFVGAIAPLAISPARRVYESAVTVGRARLAPMIVDTGDGSALTLSAASAKTGGIARLPTTTTVSFGLAGETVSTLAILPALTLGRQAIRDVEVRIEPAGGFSETIGVAGRIGSGLLQNYRVLLDPGAGRMVLKPAAGGSAAPLRSTSGLLVGLERDRLKVLHVMRGGPAATAGWQAGDTICRIDGQPIAADYPTSALARWAIGTPGTSVRLGMCDGTIRTLTLARFY
ncbi:aspartyl protease family protein [Sphingomonas sp. RP10(2022)]|uniref:Aspartyl protease family protein n=1 Tax=Sphingomonas liriopis TaxID=2949094 RepID=A0A9X2KRU6_9SPHN|nr:aspartyl protease family protein [Sphingomonas liriopis]MCP3736452.1 aspartyl protease family protein [Sphingomonas liriopis]